MQRHPLLDKAVALLQRLIVTPSPSREENRTADIWEEWLRAEGVDNVERLHNNVFAVAPGFDPRRPTLMLNSHHDTVRPTSSNTRDPYSPDIEDGKLYGLGSNDAGASGVALASTFLALRLQKELSYNIIFSITAAEEVMGEQGMRAFLPYLAERGLTPDVVIVGEPTDMQPAIAERGLLVLDGTVEGRAGHAARDEGINSIYLAMEDIDILRRFSPERVSDLLGPIKTNVTIIQAGSQHNIVPEKCTYVVDVRTTDAYTNEETVKMLQEIVKHSRLVARSTRVRASVISPEHPLVRKCVALGLTPFVSPTTSDRALMNGIQALKIGPGKSERSHSADEFVLISEINDALHIYPQLLM